ncbi:hypothetical protein B0H14DRAFT_2609143 [Mycena olivaceomarginata]|nr:hypothetical protein B0H14DRAFT_2609143 [Mycena olivaceomarginata]
MCDLRTKGHICLCAYASSQDLHGNVKPPTYVELVSNLSRSALDAQLAVSTVDSLSEATTLVFCLNVVRCALLRAVGSTPGIWIRSVFFWDHVFGSNINSTVVLSIRSQKKQTVLTEQIWPDWTFFGDNLALFPEEVFPDVDELLQEGLGNQPPLQVPSVGTEEEHERAAEAGGFEGSIVR